MCVGRRGGSCGSLRLGEKEKKKGSREEIFTCPTTKMLMTADRTKSREDKERKRRKDDTKRD